MKKLFLVAVLVVGITAFAQEKGGRKPQKERISSEEKVDFQVKKMTKDLDLNEKQAKEVRAIISKQVVKRASKRAEMSEVKQKQRDEMRANMEKEHAATSADMKKILTPEQYTKWENNLEERKEKMKERVMERKEKKGVK